MEREPSKVTVLPLLMIEGLTSNVVVGASLSMVNVTLVFTELPELFSHLATIVTEAEEAHLVVVKLEVYRPSVELIVSFSKNSVTSQVIVQLAALAFSNAPFVAQVLEIRTVAFVRTSLLVGWFKVMLNARTPDTMSMNKADRRIPTPIFFFTIALLYLLPCLYLNISNLIAEILSAIYLLIHLHI